MVAQQADSKCASGEKSYIIQGDPIPWQRAGRSGPRLYDKQKMEKIMWGCLFNKQFDGAIYEGPIKVDLTFHMRISKTLEKKYGPSLEGASHFFAPDNDNLQKFLLDALKGLAWKDDSIIAEIHSQKLWSYDPRTVIVITPMRDFRFSDCLSK